MRKDRRMRPTNHIMTAITMHEMPVPANASIAMPPMLSKNLQTTATWFVHCLQLDDCWLMASIQEQISRSINTMVRRAER